MRAILSVSDKTGLLELAKGLHERGVELISTGGTATKIAEAGVPVSHVSEVTGFPEMMDGRVKTLHPAIHAGILARRDYEGDMDAMVAQGIEPIDIVVVNLYPFAKAADKPDTLFDGLIEEIDIGGPTLVRAAAKNFKFVYVLTNSTDYDEFLTVLDSGHEEAQGMYRYRLCQQAFAMIALYDTAIGDELVRRTAWFRGGPRRIAGPG